MQKRSIFCLLMALLFVSGCATTHLTESGFFNNYSEFEPKEDAPGILLHFPEGREKAYEKAKTYEGFIVDPIAVNITPERYEELGIDPEKIGEITEYFHAEITKGLQEEDYYIVSLPAKGVMRIRAALTDIVPSKPYLNLHWATKLSKAGTGGASVEAEFIDSLTEERIVAVIYARQGRGLMYFEGLNKWGYTKDSLQKWALMLRRRLTELREGDAAKISNQLF
jgi:Protein of unknown function (DUF3313)